MLRGWRFLEAGMLLCALTDTAAAKTSPRTDLIQEGLTYAKAIACMALELAATPDGVADPNGPFPQFEA